MRTPRALAVSVAIAGLMASGTATAQAADDLDYVALGDSFSAGSGVLPLDHSAPLPCARSTRNYPHVIASEVGASLTDVTCGGAQTKHFTEEQYPALTPPQLDALSGDTDLVTMTIGGNDAGLFAGVLAQCGAAGLSTGGTGSPCNDTYGDKFDTDIAETVYPNVKQALQDVVAKAPNAEVAILSYPWVMPSSGGCFLKMPLARGDVPYVRGIQGHLAEVTERAADETGVTFVDLDAASDGHDACASFKTRWVEPALFGTNFVPVHPNARGERGMAEHTIAALGYANASGQTSR